MKQKIRAAQSQEHSSRPPALALALPWFETGFCWAVLLRMKSPETFCQRLTIPIGVGLPLKSDPPRKELDAGFLGRRNEFD